MPLIIVGLVLIGLLCAFLWWLLITTEGVYLGRSVVIWLYDLYATRYDRIKQFDPAYDHLLLANPIMGHVAPQQSPLVLDVATGSGRLPDALLDHSYFQGKIIGVDLSRRMLVQAAQKIRDDLDHLSFIWAPAERLPFDDNAFDVVACLESLEFMSDLDVVICEMVRVLRPGGLLLTSNRIGTRLMPGKLLSREDLTALLGTYGVVDVLIEPWQEDYHRVWGMKVGDSLPVGARSLIEVLRCPHCGSRFEAATESQWRCTQCESILNHSPEGIYDLFPLYS